MIKMIYEKNKIKKINIIKRNNLIANLVTHINKMFLERKNESELTKVVLKRYLTRFILYKNSFYHHLLFKLFYEKYNYTILPYDLLDELSFYYKHLSNMINTKKYIKSTDLSIIQLKIANLLDKTLHKNEFNKKSLLIERVENVNDRNNFYKYRVNDDENQNQNQNQKIFIKKLTYTKNKINECEYEVEFDIFDKISELLIQTNLYNHYEDLIAQKKMVYNPIPQIYQFYHNISNKDKYGNIINELYIEMEEIDGMRLDTYLHKKIFNSQNSTQEYARKSVRDILNVYMMICRLLIPLQNQIEFIHCDLKGSNILIGKDRRLRFIDFEYSCIKKDGFYLFSHPDFSFNENYNFFNTEKYYTLDLIKLYTSPYRFCSDLLYLFLTTLTYKNDYYEIQKYIIESIFKYNNINMFNVLIMNKLPYEAYVYSKDMDLLKEICKMYFVNFDEFIMRFNPQNMIHILNELLYNLS